MSNTSGPPGSKLELPRLIISWPDDLRPGGIGFANCFLLCPAAFRNCTPLLNVRYDFRMDHHRNDERPELQEVRDGVWNFELPISLSTRGAPMRPGRYALEFAMSFPRSQTSIKHLLCRILLTLRSDEDDADGPTFEGNWESIQSLDRDTLASLDFVLAQLNMAAEGNLREAAVEPLLSGGGLSSATSSDLLNCTNSGTSVSQVFALSVDNSRQVVAPQISRRFKQREAADGLALVFRDGRRIMLLSRKTVALGRSRESDIAVRYFPRNPMNNHLSKSISRRHIQLELRREGLGVSDCGSTKGSMLQGRVLNSSPCMLNPAGGEKQLLSLSAKPATGKDDSFSLAVKVFGIDDDARSALSPGDENRIYAEAFQSQIPDLWQTATAAGVDALRLERLTNLRFDELYVVLYRKALLGYSDDVPVFVTDPKLHSRHACFRYAQDCFWIENLAEPELTRIDGQPLPPGELVPLCAGMELQVGDCRLKVARWEQMHFDQPDA